MSYENIDLAFGKLLRTHQTILDSFNEDPSHVLDRLWSKYFTTDNFCSVKFRYHCSHHHACKSCFLLSKHFDLDVDKPFRIEYGKRANEAFVVRSKLNTPWYNIKGQYIQCDPFTCEIFIRMAIQEKYEAVGTMITAFQCRHQSYILEEACSTYDLIDQIDQHGIIDLFKQSISLLVWLEQYDFSHTALDPYHILIHGMDIGFVIDGNSSMRLGKYVICSTTPHGVSNEIEIVNETIAGVKTFQMTRKIHNARRCGINLYGCCVDLYTLMVGLMCHKDIYAVIGKYYKSFWKNLWMTAEDLEEIQEWLSQRMGSLPRIQEIIDCLDGRMLRTDALQMARDVFVGSTT
ncbi:Hypothetical protein POVR1_LOCUS255 [uncultured virus]|nr:Hypothetical protein POVR1_LOCUS255 [uncultured virus]